MGAPTLQDYQVSIIGIQMGLDADSILKDYAETIRNQCENIESQLITSGMDSKFSRLLSIQATYNTMKQLLVELNDKKTTEEVYQVLELDGKALSFPIEPNVPTVGHA